jgi:23S rRNA (uracil1939-C5)-methyltransferase
MAQPPRPKRPANAPRPPRKTAKPALPTVETTIDHLDDDGVGIGRHGGKELLVAGAFPGEKVRAALEREGQRRSVGLLREVLVPHPQRIKGPCRCAGDCLGCPLITLAYPAQLQVKEARVRAALAGRAALARVPVAPVWGAEQPFGYRTNAKLVLAKERGKVRIGLYRRGSHQVVDIGDCPLHHPLINRIVATVRAEIERQQIWVWDAKRQRGLLRYLLVRISPASGKAMVTFVTAEKDFRQLPRLAKALKTKHPEIVSVQQNVNPSSGNVIFGRDTLRLVGTPDLFDQLGEVRLRIAPTAFFQVNHEQAARIYALVRQWAALTREESAVDLYCGIGGIALHLARDAGRVIGIEVVEEAVRNARENARLNGLENCRFLAGEAEELVQDLTHEIPPGAVAVVNPPRGGCEPAVLEALAGLGPRLLIYVSCNPETLARDLELLAGHGYRTEQVQPVDMFPQTGHVESVARLVPDPRGKRPKPRH